MHQTTSLSTSSLDLHMAFNRRWSVADRPAYLQRLERLGVSVAVQDDVVGHAEALSDSQMVEERGLAESIRHLHNSYV